MSKFLIDYQMPQHIFKDIPPGWARNILNSAVLTQFVTKIGF